MESLTSAFAIIALPTECPATPEMQAGQPWPLGASFDGTGINFAIFSAHAQAMDVCIFDFGGQHEIARFRLPAHTSDVWHGYLPGAQPGLAYGLRAHGIWRPDRGHCFNVSKLLLDPYARDIVGHFDWRDEHFAGDRLHPRHMDTRDNAALALKARVTFDQFDWAGDKAPRVPLADSVVYECHVKGFSKLNASIPPALRGTFAGLAHPASVTYLKQLGITAVSLLPVQYALSEERLSSMGLSNYWGYNTLGFFCVDPRLASGVGGVSPRDEFRAMVKALHAAGLEVLLDVVYNHTAEAGDGGPTISFRGLDNASYYRLPPEAPAFYDNYSGCGNTLDVRQPRVLQMVLDSLRYWVGDMHVDGFRFDLAPVLGRTDTGFDRNSAFFTAVAQDPVLSRVKMVAEPWDIGPDGYQTGNFPRGWLEWNDRFRDSMRGFWIQTAAAFGAPVADNTRADMAQRLCGSSDMYQPRQRAPAESVNYVVSHDGFTLLDLVSYNQRHNLANLEDNRDGHGHNLNFNCGVEGPSDAPGTKALRGNLQRALLATTLLAQGTPLICAGDELGHTQGGNNNPYCQDNPTTWIDWATADEDLIAFTRRVVALRRQALPFANHWYSGVADVLGLPDLSWLRGSGLPLEGDAWRDPQHQVLGCLIGKPGKAKAPLLLLVNAGNTVDPFLLPTGSWQLVLDTTHPHGLGNWSGKGKDIFLLPANSLMLLAANGAGLSI